MTITLRPYQQTAVNRLFWDLQQQGNSLCVLPTGSGKSVVIANFAKKIVTNVLILQPSKEILQQNYKKLLLYVPRNQVGIYSASFNSKQVKKFTFATIGSIYKKPSLFQNFGIMIIDESHLMNPKNLKGMFTSFIEKVSQIRGAKVKVFGFTATPYRNMQGYHTDKNGVLQSATTLKLINRIQPKFWQRIIHNVSVKDLMDDGYLSPLKYVDKLEFDHQRIPQNKSGSDFDLHKFSMMLMPHEKRILEDIKEYQDKHKSVLVFCSWVKDAMRYSEILKGSAFVHGKTKPKERDKIIEDFKTGKIKTVFNVGCLTTGFDHPELDAIVLLRPTRSLGLYYQIVGRGLRIAQGKTHCTVYDYTSNVKNLGRIETIELVKEKGLLDAKPMWYLKTEVGQFHNKPLYEFEVQKKEKENE